MVNLMLINLPVRYKTAEEEIKKIIEGLKEDVKDNE